MRPATYVSEIIDATNTSFTGGPIPLNMWTVPGWSMHTEWNQLAADGQTVDITLTWEATNDPKAWSDLIKSTSTANWIAVSTLITYTNPTTGAGEAMVNVSFGNWSYMRLTGSRNSGAGRFTAYFSEPPR